MEDCDNDVGDFADGWGSDDDAEELDVVAEDMVEVRAAVRLCSSCFHRCMDI
jgi:hypothetical protein